MNAGQVQFLLILGGNPVYDAPADFQFQKALAKVKTSVHVGLHFNETSLNTTWHIPEPHFRRIGETRAFDGNRFGDPAVDCTSLRLAASSSRCSMPSCSGREDHPTRSYARIGREERSSGFRAMVAQDDPRWIDWLRVRHCPRSIRRSVALARWLRKERRPLNWS